MLESNMMLQPMGQEQRISLQHYINEVLGAGVEWQECPPTPLPAYLQNAYSIACGRVQSTDYVFATPSGNGVGGSPSGYSKQAEKLAQAFGQPVVLLLPTLSARDRQRLVRYRTPFIVPFRQLYMPHSGADFRERVVEASLLVAVDIPGKFQPSTQSVLLYVLLTGGHCELHIGALAHALRVSEMTISRALRDLEGVGLVERWKQGRRRPARLAGASKDVWERAQRHLISPVKEWHEVLGSEVLGALDAGLTALAQISNLAAPRTRTVALGPREWRAARREPNASTIAPVEANASDLLRDDDQVVVEVWTYDPTVLSAERLVDPLSLYLTLRNDSDERVQSALAEALTQVPWL